jgi:hypothetical protein
MRPAAYQHRAPLTQGSKEKDPAPRFRSGPNNKPSPRSTIPDGTIEDCNRHRRQKTARWTRHLSHDNPPDFSPVEKLQRIGRLPIFPCERILQTRSDYSEDMFEATPGSTHGIYRTLTKPRFLFFFNSPNLQNPRPPGSSPDQKNHPPSNTFHSLFRGMGVSPMRLTTQNENPKTTVHPVRTRPHRLRAASVSQPRSPNPCRGPNPTTQPPLATSRERNFTYEKARRKSTQHYKQHGLVSPAARQFQQTKL